MTSNPSRRKLRFTICEKSDPCLLKIFVSLDGRVFEKIEYKKGPKLFLRALSILLLLVNYLGSDKADAKGQLEFKVPEDRKTWINTLVNGLSQNHSLADFFGSILADTYFITTMKATFGHANVVNKKPASIKFNIGQLLPENIEIHKSSSPSGYDDLIEEKPEILKLAKSLESHKSAKVWEPVIDEIISAFNTREQEKRNDSNQILVSKMQTQDRADLQPHIDDDSVSQQLVWMFVEERIRSPINGETWCIVSDSLHEFLTLWDSIRRAIVRQNVRVKWVFHSPKALAKCKSMQAQWEKYHHSEFLLNNVADDVTILENQIRNLKKNARRSIPKRSNRTRQLELYQSFIALPFTAFLAEPENIPDLQECWEKTMCGIFYHTMFNRCPPFSIGRLENRFRRATLLFYYEAIGQLFDLGCDRGYFKRMLF